MDILVEPSGREKAKVKTMKRFRYYQYYLFDVKFLFSEKHIFRKQKRTAAYGREFLVLGIKVTRENEDVLSSTHK